MPRPQQPGQIQHGRERAGPQKNLQQPQPRLPHRPPCIEQQETHPQRPEVNKSVRPRPHQPSPRQPQLEDRPPRTHRQCVQRQRQEEHHEPDLLPVNAEIHYLGVEGKHPDQHGRRQAAQGIVPRTLIQQHRRPCQQGTAHHPEQPQAPVGPSCSRSERSGAAGSSTLSGEVKA